MSDKVISDIEWAEFIDCNTVSEDVIEVIALRIINSIEQTEREIAIYKEHSERIESKIKTMEDITITVNINK